MTTAARAAARTRDLDSVGEVEFALGVVVADARKHAKQIVDPEGHDAGIAQPHAAFLGAGVLVLADGVQPAGAVREQAPVAGRIGRLEPEHRYTGALVEAGKQLGERLGRQQRRIGIEHEHIARMARECFARGQHRVGGAALMLLHERPCAAGAWRQSLGAHRVHVGADDHRQGVGAELLRHGQHVAEHRAAGDLVQHLRQRRFHARALTGGKDDNQQGAAAHQALAFVWMAMARLDQTLTAGPTHATKHKIRVQFYTEPRRAPTRRRQCVGTSCG